jgi:hypothetical protein
VKCVTVQVIDIKIVILNIHKYKLFFVMKCCSTADECDILWLFESLVEAHYYYYYYYYLQLSCHSVAAVLTPVQTKQIGINLHKGNNTKNTVQTIQNIVNTSTH